MLSKKILGLDLGSFSMKAVELEAGLRGVEVTAMEQLVLPAHAAPEEREATIQLFLEQKNLSRDHVITALSADRASQRHLRFPFSGKRVDQAVPFEIDENVPVNLEDVVITHEKVPASPTQTNVLAVLAPRNEVELYLQSVRRMEMEPRLVEVEGAVLANLSGYLQLADVGRLVLDIGHAKTTLCLLVDSKPALLRTISVAGRHLTAAIAKDERMALEAAENLKHDSGLFEAFSTKPRSASVRDVLEQIVRETTRSVQSAIGDPLDPIAPAEILLVGGTAAAENLPEYLEERIGLRCQRLHVPDDVEGSAMLANGDVGTFATAAALALRGSTTERITKMDLRQGAFSYVPDLSGLRGQLSLTIAIFALTVLLWIAGLGTQLWAERNHQARANEKLAQFYSEIFPQEQKPRNPTRAFEEKLREARDLASHLGVMGGGVSVLEVLRQISERIPPDLDVSLYDLRLERHSVRARGYSPDFESVDKVRQELEKVAVFDSVVLSDVVNVPRRSGKSFALTIKFAGNPDE